LTTISDSAKGPYGDLREIGDTWMVIIRYAGEHRRVVGFAAMALVIYVIPVMLILAGIIPVAYRFHMLVAMTIVVVVVAWWLGMSPPALGLHKRELTSALFWNGLLSLLFVVVLVVAYASGGIRSPTVPQWKLFFIFYVFVSSPCQEFLYRGFLFALMERAGMCGLAEQVVVSSMLYSFLHIFYRDWLTMVVTLLMGVLWGLIYARHRNLWPVMGSHAVLGVVSILTGVV
jgi:membrane protease YdiL (CAAX protease family)